MPQIEWLRLKTDMGTLQNKRYPLHLFHISNARSDHSFDVKNCIELQHSRIIALQCRMHGCMPSDTSTVVCGYVTHATAGATLHENSKNVVVWMSQEGERERRRRDSTILLRPHWKLVASTFLFGKRFAMAGYVLEQE
jgi:hypothetical protein